MSLWRIKSRSHRQRKAQNFVFTPFQAQIRVDKIEQRLKSIFSGNLLEVDFSTQKVTLHIKGSYYQTFNHVTSYVTTACDTPSCHPSRSEVPANAPDIP